MIIVKKTRRSPPAHHGGAWKVAYADFVTAMMAFFLLLWLLNAVSQEQLQGISDYFAPISMQKATSGGGGLMQGKTVDTHGVFNARTQHINVFAEMRPSEEDELAAAEAGEHPADARQPSDAELEKFLRQREEVQFKQAEQQLRLAIDASSELKGLANNLLVDNTPEGLRIQIVDQEGMAMFPLGSAAMLPHTQALIELVARIVEKMPQDIEISDHTDANPFSGEHDYGNWELSADRANAARRMFVRAGVPEARIMRVVGKAATAPLFPQEPKAPGNRRLSVVLLRGTGDAT